MSQLSDRIRARRTDKGWSQAALASATGVSQPTVANWENGSHIPRNRVLGRISEVLDVEASWLLTGGSTEAPKAAAHYLSAPIRHIPIYNTLPQAEQAVPIGFIPYSTEHADAFAISADETPSPDLKIHICIPDRQSQSGPFLLQVNDEVKLGFERPEGGGVVGRVLATVVIYDGG